MRGQYMLQHSKVYSYFTSLRQRCPSLGRPRVVGWTVDWFGVWGGVWGRSSDTSFCRRSARGRQRIKRCRVITITTIIRVDSDQTRCMTRTALGGIFIGHLITGLISRHVHVMGQISDAIATGIRTSPTIQNGFCACRTGTRDFVVRELGHRLFRS